MTAPKVNNINVVQITPIPSPQKLLTDLPISEELAIHVSSKRAEVGAILDSADDRLIVIVGPCSIHDTKAAIEYANMLKEKQQELKSDLLIVMRVYFEKPRTVSGWKGLVNDPNLDETFDIDKGLKIGRQLLLNINKLGLPCAVEFLDVITPQYLSDLVTYGAIGARTVESQVHRELASGISAPIGFKNSTSGDIVLTANAVKSASKSHRFLSVNGTGDVSIVHSTGNRYAHIILRGGSTGPNYSADHIAATVLECQKQEVSTKIIVDCSHGNSLKKHKNQILVADDIAKQVSSGQHDIVGVMIESNINEGNQPLTSSDLSSLKYGVSITDACIHFQDTVAVLDTLAKAVQARRTASPCA